MIMGKYERIEHKPGSDQAEAPAVVNSALEADEEVRSKLQDELNKEKDKKPENLISLLGKGIKTFGKSLKKAVKDEDLL